MYKLSPALNISSAFVMKLTYAAGKLTLDYERVIDTSDQSFRASQGMRLFFQPASANANASGNGGAGLTGLTGHGTGDVVVVSAAVEVKSDGSVLRAARCQ